METKQQITTELYQEKYIPGQIVILSGRIYDGNKKSTIIRKEMIFSRIIDENIYDSPNDRIFIFTDENNKEIGFYPEDICSIKII